MGESSSEVGIRALKRNLTAILARVRRGETVTVTSRRQVIARIVPAAADHDVASVLQAFVRSGRISWSGGKPVGLGRPGRVRGASVSDAVVQDRR